jgi:hypothetical protein
MNEYQVPLVERLKSVPDHARFVQEEEFSSAYYPVGELCHQAADRIAELEKKHTTLQTQFDNLYELANNGDEMNTEPVAYRWRSDLGYIYDIYDHGGGEPVYTRPNEHDLGIAEAIGFDKGYQAATAKTLTDEEIHKIWASENGLEDMDMCKYADFLETFRFVERAILRKEQEK